HIGDVDGRFLTDAPALGVALAGLHMTRDHVDAGHQHFVILGENREDFALGSLVLASDDDDIVVFLDALHHNTSGARLMILRNCLARSSRATGPKMRVPIGCFWLSMSTALFVSKRIRLPSARRRPLRERTTTAFMTEPFFTRLLGNASRIETTLTSPMLA